jgi:RNA polymerase sigma-70 factor (ECF subfamily)
MERVTMTYTDASTSPRLQQQSNSLHPNETLVDAARSGSAAAFSELYRLYQRRIYRTILSITRNREDAEDAMQDAFMKAYRAINSFEGRASFYTWLSRIAFTSALMVLRKRRAHPELLIDMFPDGQESGPSFEFKDSSPNPEQTYHFKEEHTRLVEAVQNLSPRLRIVVQEHLLQDGSTRETARTLDLTETAVKSRLYRARKQLSEFGASKALSA